ncbi:ABC transporter ATP-binding protein [Halorubrum trueperi]|uniref:ABC transporter ATP-binding protein n=1 Tax=Halorubrum trueperi TaxID=2004704 RepID=A0ABD5UPC7_9EURY
MSEPLLEIDGLDIRYETKDGEIHAVTDASFAIDTNEFFGLVGESGSGKSTIAKSIIGGLDDNGSVTAGEIRFRGEPIHSMTERELSERIRWKEIAYIPQASMNSLDPIMRLDKQAVELAKVHTDWSKQRAIDRLTELFEVVGLPGERIYEYPHQFSGGMQQRAIIAFSLFLEPSLLIADEPTTALDVIMQDQILTHLKSIQEEEDVSIVMITHDISVIFENCDSMAVLHGGQVSELGDVTRMFDSPSHPYSYLLQQAFPDIRHPKRDLSVIEGQPPQLQDEVDYCTFANRCPWSTDECVESRPPLQAVGDDNQYTSCIRYDEIEELGHRSPENTRSEVGGSNHE